LSPAFEGYQTQYATTVKGAKAPSGTAPVVHLIDASRTHPLKLAMMYLQVLWLVLRVRPHIVITTGAAPGLAALQISKLFGARTVWIDSLANSEQLSLSGHLAERYADLWLTQWPHLTASHPNLKSFGAVL
jgi:hypothetical protein